MSFTVNLQALHERALKRAATPATVATLLPDEGSKLAGVAGLQYTADLASDVDRWCWPHSSAMNSGELAALAARRDRLMRWGWSAAEAEALADRLTLNARDKHDDRVSCTDCRHYRPGRCGNQAAAGLHSPEVGRDLAALLQRCEGFTGTPVP